MGLAPEKLQGELASVSARARFRPKAATSAHRQVAAALILCGGGSGRCHGEQARDLLSATGRAGDVVSPVRTAQRLELIATLFAEKLIDRHSLPPRRDRWRVPARSPARRRGSLPPDERPPPPPLAADRPRNPGNRCIFQPFRSSTPSQETPVPLCSPAVAPAQSP